MSAPKKRNDIQELEELLAELRAGIQHLVEDPFVSEKIKQKLRSIPNSKAASPQQDPAGMRELASPEKV